jgi:iron complex outermembrane recepter protein
MKYSATIRHRLSWGLALLWLMAATVASVGQEKKDLSEASLEDLMNIRVTSVSRTERMLSQTPSAVFVITAEDIRQSGATNIAEALRIAPGVNVARINANTWAISVRGFNGRFADELLVMVDVSRAE